MLSSSVSAVFNGFTVSAFAQNVGLVAITGIKSRFVVAVGGGILVFLGLFPVLGALVALVPLPVLGGAGLALFGTVAASGIRTLVQVEFAGNANLVIVALSIAGRGHPDRRADLLGQVPRVVPGDLRQRHHLRRDDGRAARTSSSTSSAAVPATRRPIFAEAPAARRDLRRGRGDA